MSDISTMDLKASVEGENNDAYCEGEEQKIVDEDTPTKVDDVDVIDVDVKKDQPTTKGTSLSFWDILAIQTSWSTAAVVVMMPYIYGQLGYVLALIVTAIWMLLTYLVACFICDVVISSNGRCRHLADAGYELGGKWGRITFRTFQYANLLFYLPVALETIAISLQVVFGYPFNEGNGCIGWWKLITFGVLFIAVMLTRNWKESSRLAYVTWVVLTIKAFILIPYGLAKYKDVYHMSEENLGKSQPFGNPQPNFWDISGCLIGYMSSSMMLLVETMSHAEKPQEYKKALGYANILMWIYYAVPGLCSALIWGWNVEFLINESGGAAFESNPVSIALNVFIAIPVTLDFIIASIPVNDSIRLRFIDKNVSDEDAPMRGKYHFWHQFKVTFPTLVFSFILTTVVPHFEVLTSLLSSLTLVPMVTFVPSLVWLFGGKRNDYKTSILLHLASVGIGVTIFGTEFAYAVNGILETNYEPSNFWCQS